MLCHGRFNAPQPFFKGRAKHPNLPSAFQAFDAKIHPNPAHDKPVAAAGVGLLHDADVTDLYFHVSSGKPAGHSPLGGIMAVYYNIIGFPKTQQLQKAPRFCGGHRCKADNFHAALFFSKAPKSQPRSATPAMTGSVMPTTVL